MTKYTRRSAEACAPLRAAIVMRLRLPRAQKTKRSGQLLDKRQNLSRAKSGVQKETRVGRQVELPPRLPEIIHGLANQRISEVSRNGGVPGHWTWLRHWCREVPRRGTRRRNGLASGRRFHRKFLSRARVRPGQGDPVFLVSLWNWVFRWPQLFLYSEVWEEAFGCCVCVCASCV